MPMSFGSAQRNFQRAWMSARFVSDTATIPRAAPWFRLVSCTVAFVVALLSVHTAWACSCGGDWEKPDADVVFRGEVVEVHVPLHLQIHPERVEGVVGFAWALWFTISRPFDEDVRTVFHVTKAWKGAPSEYVTLNTGSGMCCNCTVGNIFKQGTEYVVYANEYQSELHIGWCGGAAVALEDLPPSEAADLGPGAPPASGGRGLPLLWRHLLLPAALGGPIALIAALWRWRSRRRQRGSADRAHPSQAQPGGR
jgi:hypothetical protein